jgi:YD repeat-containing protein
VSRTRRIVISAEGSRDPQHLPLAWHWSVLRGDADAIRIRPLNASRSVVELIVPYHPRRPIEAGSQLESNRVDIGAFVHNGTYYSAPAFVTFFYLDNEQRVYSPDGRIESVTYTGPGGESNYTDPVLQTPKSWRDEYRYDASQRLVGWTRHRGQVVEDFTADGAQVTQRDASGRPTEARTVRYVAVPRGDGLAELEPRLGDERLCYEYDSAEDRVGRIRAREKVTAADLSSADSKAR